MTTSTEIAVRPRAVLAPVHPLRAVAAEVADPGFVGAVEEFLRVVEASRQAWERLRLTDTGNNALADEAERLDTEAEDAWAAVAAWGVFLPEEIASAGTEYVGRRRRVVPKAASSGDWRESVGTTDWSRSGRDAA